MDLSTENTAEKLTPLMRQFWDIKNQHMDKLLLFRMGDFYEMFYQDAVTAAPILNIALTARNKKALDETPMCGVPYHSIATPIGKLLAAGYKVAICEQLEDPAEAKGLVKRGVTRVLSPGMVYDPDSLQEMQTNFVASYDDKTVSFLDSTTGQALTFVVSEEKNLSLLLGLLKPVELVVTAAQRQSDAALWPDDLHLTVFDDLDLDWPEPFSKLSESAARLLTYAVRMQGTAFLAAVKNFEWRGGVKHLQMTPSLIRHLEIFESYRGTDKGSLFYAIDRTKTSAGKRKLKSWLSFPLMDLSKITERQAEVTKWQSDMPKLKKLREALGRLGDLERRISKLSYVSCHSRDLLALRNSLSVAEDICVSYAPVENSVMAETKFCIDLVDRAISEDPPAQMRNGGIIKKGFDPKLDELIGLAEDSHLKLAELEAKERQLTGISSLKVKFNQVFGYYIEITNTHKEKVPARYMRKQTLANAERFTTDELTELESKVLTAKSKRLELEEAIYHEVRISIQKKARAILQMAEHLSDLDALSAFSWLALEQNYVVPLMIDEGDLKLMSSRHPVVEQEVSKSFVSNDVGISKGQVFLLTGPNMAGKSTLMRQVAICVLLAQIGAPVPCKSAQIPIFERVFTRIGASDHLSEGLSTFMVEMKESAEILRELGSRSLVVLDEIGRGTSTYDGMSLAQAILEQILANGKAHVFFATHYHELTELATTKSKLVNCHMAISEKNGQVSFLHKLKDGPALRSYGIHVAELAGLPKPILQRAEALLKSFEARVKSQFGGEQLDLVAMSTHDDRFNELVNKIKAVNISKTTPLEALQLLDKIQSEI